MALYRSREAANCSSSLQGLLRFMHLGLVSVLGAPLGVALHR